MAEDFTLPDSAQAVNARVNSVIARLQADSEAVVAMADARGWKVEARISALLSRADAELGRRLTAANAGPGSASFSAASAAAYRRQLGAVVDQVKAGVSDAMAPQRAAVWAQGVQATTAALSGLETAFTGVTSRAPRIREALQFDPDTSRRASSVLRSSLTSVDRYGVAMIGEFESHLALGFAAGLTQTQMIELLTGHGGPRGEVSLRARVEAGQVIRTQTAQIPEGLFVQRRYWAQRIVRTESANAYNAARMDRMDAMRGEFPTMKKKILAHFDRRTAMDSVGVHGEVRDVAGPNSYFVDGAGRVYEHPPARPNDRETVIPWLEEWGEVTSTAPLTPDERQLAGANLAAGRVPFDPQARRLADIGTETARAQAVGQAVLGQLAAPAPVRRPRAPRPAPAPAVAPAPAPTPIQPTTFSVPGVPQHLVDREHAAWLALLEAPRTLQGFLRVQGKEAQAQAAAWRAAYQTTGPAGRGVHPGAPARHATWADPAALHRSGQIPLGEVGPTGTRLTATVNGSLTYVDTPSHWAPAGSAAARAVAIQIPPIAAPTPAPTARPAPVVPVAPVRPAAPPPVPVQTPAQQAAAMRAQIMATRAANAPNRSTRRQPAAPAVVTHPHGPGGNHAAPPPQRERMTGAAVREWGRTLNAASRVDGRGRYSRADQARLRAALDGAINRWAGLVKDASQSGLEHRDRLSVSVYKGSVGYHRGATDTMNVDPRLPAFFTAETQALARGTFAPTIQNNSGLGGLRTYIHETLHGFSPVAGEGAGRTVTYAGIGINAEEFAVEIQARRVTANMRAALAEDAGQSAAAARTQAFGTASASGGYQGLIGEVLQAAQAHTTGHTQADILDRCADAAARTWTDPTSRATIAAAQQTITDFHDRLTAAVVPSGPERVQFSRAIVPEQNTAHPAHVYASELIRHLTDVLEIPAAQRRSFDSAVSRALMRKRK